MLPALRLLLEGAVTVQVTAVLAVPLMVAANCSVDPMLTVAGLGVMATTGVGGAVGGVDPLPPPLPQAVSAMLRAVAIHTAALLPNCSMVNLSICAAAFSAPGMPAQGPLAEPTENDRIILRCKCAGV